MEGQKAKEQVELNRLITEGVKGTDMTGRMKQNKTCEGKTFKIKQEVTKLKPLQTCDMLEILLCTFSILLFV